MKNVTLKTDIVYSTERLTKEEAKGYFETFKKTAKQEEYLEVSYDSNLGRIYIRGEMPDYSLEVLGVYISNQMSMVLNPDTDLEVNSVKFAFNKARTTMTATIRAVLKNEDLLKGQN